ncbi:MAG: hypothetical protein K8R36_19620 [Planctomycetales bacterium]|nr:hypothetical protein [Planctomycetales bacterium]
MSIVVSCKCGQSFAAMPHLAGTVVACPVCRSPISIPLPSPTYTQQPLWQPTPVSSGGVPKWLILAVGAVFVIAVVGLGTIIAVVANYQSQPTSVTTAIPQQKEQVKSAPTTGLTIQAVEKAPPQQSDPAFASFHPIENPSPILLPPFGGVLRPEGSNVEVWVHRPPRSSGSWPMVGGGKRIWTLSNGKYTIYHLGRSPASSTVTLLDYFSSLKVHEGKKETLEQSFVHFAGNPGIKFTIRQPQYKLIASGYLFLINNEIHELVTSGADYQIDTAENRWFLQSFRIRDKNGPGLVLGSMTTDPRFIAAMPKSDLVPAIPLPNEGRIWYSENLQMEAWIPDVGGAPSVRTKKDLDGKNFRDVYSEGSDGKNRIHVSIHEIIYSDDLDDNEIQKRAFNYLVKPARSITLGPFVGMEATIDRTQHRVYVINRVVYDLRIINRTQSPPQEERFFASFRPRVPGTPMLKLGTEGAQ